MSGLSRASSGGPPPAPEERIIKHMNADHQDSLRRYLEHYHALSSFSARNAHLTDISFTTLTLSTSTITPSQPPPASASGASKKYEIGSSTYHIPLDPPLKSWAEARERLVSMDKLCVEKLNRSSITLNTYIFPRGFHLFLGILTICTLITFSSSTHLQPHKYSTLFGPLPIWIPGWFSFLTVMQQPVLWFMIVVHGGESVWMARTRLRKHSVPVASGLWWKWVLGTFFEGFGNFERIDVWVEEQIAKRARQKH